MIKLLPVKLQGIDTSEIESLPSYIARLAYYHCASVGEIIRIVLSEFPKAQLEDKTYYGPESILQPNESTITIVDSLSLITGQPVEQCAFIWMYKALGRSSLELVKGYRWCPECFSEMNKAGVDPYIKLKWHLKAIKFCPIHKTDFEWHCQECGCKQTSYKRVVEFSCCQDCGASLARRKVSVLPKDVHTSWEDNGFDILKLFDELADIKYSSFPENGVLKSLTETFDYYWDKGEEYKFYQLFGRDEAIGLMHKQKPISLLKARRIAFKLGVSLRTLMNGDAAKLAIIIDPKLWCVFPEGYAAVRKRNTYNHEAKLKLILDYLEKTNSPSLKSVAESVSVSTGYLRNRYPVLTQSIVDAYLSRKEEEQLRKIYKAQKLALQYFYDEKYASYPKSMRQAYKEVKHETGLAKGVIEQAVKRAYGAMH